ncbi:MAG TPA: OmpW family outer membrane protein [Gemmatimonadaceae bacterium]
MRSLGNAVRLMVLASIVGTSAAQAQGGIALGYTDLGAVIGLGGLGGANIALGGRFERIFKALPDMGDGLLGLQVGVDWWSWDYGYFGGNNTGVSYIPIGVTANYHFKMENKKFDPFLGAGLGYQIVNVNASCVIQGVDYCRSYSSEIYVIVKGGIRYFMNSSTALYADVGAGAATLNVGAVFRLKGGS